MVSIAGKVSAAVVHLELPEFMKESFEMKMGALPLMAALLGGLLASNANAQHVAYGPSYRGSSVLVQYAQVAEMFCTVGTLCTFNVTTQMESGFSRGEVFLTGWNAFFLPANTTYPVNKVQLAVDSGVYNSSTGVFTWKVTAELSESSGLATGFSVGVYATIILSDQAGTRLNRRNFNCTGETDAACSEYDGFSFGTSTVPFQMMAVRGFDLKTVGGQTMNLQQLVVDATSYTSAGTIVTGFPSCGILGDKLQDFRCDIDMVMIASAPAHITYNFPSWGQNSDRPVYQYDFSPWPSGSYGFFHGLRAFDLSFVSHPSRSLRYAAGCFAPRYPSVWGLPSDREWQWLGHLSDSPNPIHGEFVVANECALADVY